MAAVLIAYDLNSPGQNYEVLYEKIKAYGTWSHPLDSTWIVVHPRATAQSVSDDLKSVLDPNDRWFCVEITGQPHQGWLSKKRWEWINNNV